MYLGGWHGELDEGVLGELGRDLVVRGERHAAHQVVCRVGTCTITINLLLTCSLYIISGAMLTSTISSTY